MIELLKQMVEALEVDAYVYNGEKSWAAIKAGKQAIAELESQEPMAWMVWGENNVPALTFTKPANKYVFDALYTHPPQRTWVGLTEKEQFECMETRYEYGMSEDDIPRIIEAKLKEKNT